MDDERESKKSALLEHHDDEDKGNQSELDAPCLSFVPYFNQVGCYNSFHN